ncbi:MAG: tetratricopeptide repeat protein [Syntrophaceae bacterium]|nr:tetratricopeptide repeat protein [Syntrophaceae bacterium]
MEHPALIAIERYQKCKSPYERLDNLDLAFEFLIRTDALVMSAALISHGFRDDKVRHLLLKNKFSLGDWHSLLQASSARLPRSCLHDLQLWVRNMERRCPYLRWTGCKNSPFQTLLSIRNLRSHNEGRTQWENLEKWSEMGDCCLFRLLEEHPPLDAFILGENRELLYKSSEGNIICRPLMISGESIGEPESVLLYRCTVGNEIELATNRGRPYRSSDAYNDLMESLNRSVDLFGVVDALVSPHVLAERITESARQTVSRFSQTRTYRPGIMVQQLEAESILGTFLNGEPRLLLVDGPAGAGKTSWLCSISEQRILAGATVLLVSIDRLANLSFPDNIGSFLRVTGHIALALERLSIISSDENVVVLVDDLSESGQEEKAIQSLLDWVERLPLSSKIKIVATMRTDRAKEYYKKHNQTLSPNIVSRFHLPPLTTQELLDLAERIPVNDNVESSKILAVRCQAAIQLGELRDSSARRPGIAVSIIERLDLSGLPKSFTAFSIYSDIFNRSVLDLDDEQIPRAPLRGKILRTVAGGLFAKRTKALPLEDAILLSAGLIDLETGERSTDYRLLLSQDILVESLEEFESFVGFANPQFSEFLAAFDVPLNANLAIELHRLWQQTHSFPPSLTVAAFALARATRKFDLSRFPELIKLPEEFRRSLLAQLATVDDASPIAMATLLVGEDPAGVCDFIEWLLDSGEYRLACRIGEIIAARLLRKDLADKALYVCAKAHYELDQYLEAEEKLAQISPAMTHDVHILLGDIAASRREWITGRIAYERALEIHDRTTPSTRAYAIRGLGYIFSKLGENQKAESLLQQALVLLESLGDSKIMAETQCDLGELYSQMGRMAEARTYFERSLQVNRRIGSVVGIGIVLGFLGELDLKAGKSEKAAKQLEEALRIARRTGNRWRQAWTAKCLARMHEEQGDMKKAEQLYRDAAATFDDIDAHDEKSI